MLLAFYSRTRMPESGQLADDLATLAGEFEGRFLAGLVDIDAAPQIAQAMQIPSIPLVVAVLDGRPMPLLQDVVPARRAAHGAHPGGAAAHRPGRHRPAPAAHGCARRPTRRARTRTPSTRGTPPPRTRSATDDIDRAVAEYQKLVDANPADAEAAAGLAMAKVLQRTQGVDLKTAREAAAANPDDVDAQTMVADLDMLGGHVDDAFNRLIDLIRRSAGDERNQAREHLLGLFGAVGNDDPRVLRGRQNLASALF